MAQFNIQTATLDELCAEYTRVWDSRDPDEPSGSAHVLDWQRACAELEDAIFWLKFREAEGLK